MDEKRLVGTGEMCDLRIHDAPYMSTRHFLLTRTADGAIYVEDFGSTNGTEVNNGLGWTKAYGPIRIGPGSRIFAGRVLFKIDSAGQVEVLKDVSPFDRDKRSRSVAR